MLDLVPMWKSSYHPDCKLHANAAASGSAASAASRRAAAKTSCALYLRARPRARSCRATTRLRSSRKRRLPSSGAISIAGGPLAGLVLDQALAQRGHRLLVVPDALVKADRDAVIATHHQV